MHFRYLPSSILLLAFLSMTALVTAPTANAQEVASKSEVNALIEELGHENYARRVLAKEKLQRLGLEAFDQLHTAKFHPDSEVVSAARYLISSLMVSWSKESDPAPVREALSEYGGQEPSERESRIKLLANLPDRQGLEALVRLTR
ncbi:MAG: hypothetical protein HKN47_18645, partial [Pirellulaceae bacterium]|nr:hypothetical protein [Pirellulaceae bacterium]